MPDGGTIKLHPSFTNDPKKKEIISDIISRLAPKSIELCSDEVLLEIEMLYEPKTLIGSKSSLEYYANVFGSNYINLKLY